MKRIKPILFLITFILFAYSLFFTLKVTEKNDLNLRTLHKMHLEKSPYKNTIKLSRSERKSLGLPPNAYYERLWELTMDPQTGRPMPERLLAIKEELLANRILARGIGGDKDNAWIERGPNNVGGRTRAIMFDPNDVGNANSADDYTRVFAGGVSGGLWVNENITDANSAWTLVPGIDANISVNVIISDPNNPSIFYIGSGESYTNGDAVGRGIWKSENSGTTWNNIYGGLTSSSGQLINGIFYVNDLVARDIGTTTELYAAIAGANYSDSNDPNQFHGLQEQGLYKSINNGSSWTKYNINDAKNSPSNPNDIEIDINNNIWFTTTRSSLGFDGGKIYKSTNGDTFTLMYTIPDARRTELEPSNTNANKFWIAVDRPGPTTGDGRDVDLYFTTDGFSNVLAMPEPDDKDLGIPANDYTRNQAFYDLVIEADGSDNIIVGGIDLFRTTDDGANWSQISKWSNNPDLDDIAVSLVHADHHAVVQRPGSGNANKMVFGNDGGVYYCDNILTAGLGPTAIQSRNKNYNTVQFYSGDIFAGVSGDNLVGGTQDNGTQNITNATSNINSFSSISGGDGGFTEIDKDGDYIIVSIPFNNHRYKSYPSLPTGYYITSGDGDSEDGDFINQATLDEHLDLLYSNASTPTTYIIERTANFKSGFGSIIRTSLSNPKLDAMPTALKVSPYTTESTTLMIGLENGKLLKVKKADTSPNWINSPDTNPIEDFVGSISDIEFGVNELEVFVTIHNYGVNSVFFSNDGGVTFTSIEGNLPDIPVKCILQNPLVPKELIIGTDLGVWSTSDYTVTNPIWTQAYNGMSDVTVVDLDVRPSDNVILATTHGRGLFTSQFTSVPLSVKEDSFVNQSIKVFPTISSGELTVSTKLYLGKTNVQVFSLNGKKMYETSINLNGNSNDLKLTNLASGIYLMKFMKNNISVTKKIVIK